MVAFSQIPDSELGTTTPVIESYPVVSFYSANSLRTVASVDGDEQTLMAIRSKSITRTQDRKTGLKSMVAELELARCAPYSGALDTLL